MKKKLFALILVCFMTLNSAGLANSYIDQQIKASKKAQKYNSIQKHTANYDSELKSDTNDLKIKDPKLIKFEAEKIKKISSTQYKQKLKKDEDVYGKIQKEFYYGCSKKNIEVYKDFYKLYRVAEHLIRANKLDYVNWRICLVNATGDFNAATTEANLIYVHSALFDSLYNNEDALALVLAHEISHQILGHIQRTNDLHNSVRNKMYKATMNSLAAIAEVRNYTPPQSKYITKQNRAMEFEADVLGAELITRAGYDFNKAMDMMDFINTLGQSKSASKKSSHPHPEERIENLKTVQKYFLPQWVDEGKYNVYNSGPIGFKISSDASSIIITSKNKTNNGFYQQESPEDLLKRLGYIDYKNKNMKNAVKYFSQWAELSNSYIPHLYLSYSYEYLYNQTKKPKYLENAQTEIKTAKLISPDNEHIKKQIIDLAGL